MVITDMKPRRGRLVELCFAGGSPVRMDKEICALSGLRIGQELSEEAVQTLCAQSDERRAWNKALWLLGQRAYASGELCEKLRRDTSPAAADRAVSRLAELGYLDDRDFAVRYADELFRKKGWAAKRVRDALVDKCIDKELADEVAEIRAPDPRVQISGLLKGKLGQTLLRDNGRDKAIAALRRSGFAWDDIKPCLAQAQETLEDETDAGAGSVGIDIEYLLSAKYAHALRTEKDRARTVRALIKRGADPDEAEEAVKRYTGDSERE